MTLVTLSVSLSVTILVPLALKGYVRRDRIIPYVMGANIATWIDTLFAALLLDSPRGLHDRAHGDDRRRAVSLIVLFFFYKPYTAADPRRRAPGRRSSRRNLAVFLGAICSSCRCCCSACS